MKNIFLILSIGLFMVALTQKCYCTNTTVGSPCGDSLAAFLFGFFGIFYGGAALVWFANPLLISSWIFSKNIKLSLILSVLSTLIALFFLLFDKIIDDEAGNIREITGYKLGYWLWLASNLVMLIGNTLSMIKTEN